MKNFYLPTVCINIEEDQSFRNTVVVSQLSGQTILILWCMDLAEHSFIFVEEDCVGRKLKHLYTYMYLRVLTQLMATGPHAWTHVPLRLSCACVSH